MIQLDLSVYCIAAGPDGDCEYKTKHTSSTLSTVEEVDAKRKEFWAKPVGKCPHCKEPLMRSTHARHM